MLCQCKPRLSKGEGILSEANGERSREQITVVSGQNLGGMFVIGKITASGKYKEYDNAAADGSEAAAGVLIGAVDASAADKLGVILARDAEVDLRVGSRVRSCNDALSTTQIGVYYG